MEKLNVFIVDNNDTDIRMRLKHAVMSTNEFDTCLHAATIRDALSRIEAGDRSIDIIFISYHFTREQIAEFASMARELTNAQESSLVMLLPSGSAQNSSLAEIMQAGVDGFLLEPYSSDDLVKITRLASRVSKDKATTREFVNIKFLVKDQIRLLDAVCCLHRGDLDTSQTFDKFRKLCLQVRDLQPESYKNYLSVLIDACERSMVPVQIPRNPYSGKSERTKRKVDQMLISRLESPKPKLDPKKEVLVDGKVLKLPPVPK